jgi:hypothetical protein
VCACVVAASLVDLLFAKKNLSSFAQNAMTFFDKTDMEVLVVAGKVVAVLVCVDRNCVLSVSGFHCDGLNPAAGMELIISNI